MNPSPLAFTLRIDPMTLCTAQQKKIAWRQRVVFSNPKVLASMRLIRAAVAPYQPRAREIFDNAPHHAVAVQVVFFIAYPKTGTKAEIRARRSGTPITTKTSGDVDNRVKAFLDALTQAHFWDDDKYVTSLTVKKRYTLVEPRILVGVQADDGDSGLHFSV